jgi:hypothetical protein
MTVLSAALRCCPQAAALRVLAILGENDLVRRAAGKPPIQGRGLRILSLGAPLPAALPTPKPLQHAAAIGSLLCGICGVIHASHMLCRMLCRGCPSPAHHAPLPTHPYPVPQMAAA